MTAFQHFGVELMIPDSWDAWTFGGFVYRRKADGSIEVRYV